MSGSGPPVPQPFQPPDQAGAASGQRASATGLQNLGNVTTAAAIPGYQSIYQAVTNNPYYQQTQAQAGQTGTAGVNFGQSELQAASGLQALGTSLGQYAPGIAATAFDPQHALYNRTQQQITDQSNAMNAMNGVAGSPFGAGLANDANRNFNIDWQNNQQQRQNAGVAALGQLASTQGGLQTAAGEVGAAGLNNMNEGGRLASDIFMDQQTHNRNALDALVQGDSAAGEPYKAAGQLDTQYLGVGQLASQNALAAEQQQYKQDNAFWGAIGSLAGDAFGLAGQALGFGL